MPDRKEHLKAVKKFLGWKGNIWVHTLLDGGDLPKKLRIIYHKTTHDPNFIDKNICPPNFTDRDNLEAYFHLLHDLGFIKLNKK